MSRWWICTAAVTMLSAMGGVSPARAQSDLGPDLPSPTDNAALSPSFSVPGELPIVSSSSEQYDPFASGPPTRFVNQQIASPGGMPGAGVPYSGGAAQQSGYVRLNAPMYPCPRPNIPIWTGSTMITNQAFAPHEMLYPHKYRAMYPPFYHRVHGCYFWTPFGMRSHEQWKLQGTMVKVNYRSHWPCLMGPHKPWVSTWGGPWK